jgi:hypothetical protein
MNALEGRSFSPLSGGLVPSLTTPVLPIPVSTTLRIIAGTPRVTGPLALFRSRLINISSTTPPRPRDLLVPPLHLVDPDPFIHACCAPDFLLRCLSRALRRRHQIPSLYFLRTCVLPRVRRANTFLDGGHSLNSSRTPVFPP